AQIDSMNFPTLALGVKRVVIGRIEQNVKAIAAGERSPIRITDLFLALDAARANPVFVVLQTARDSEIRFRIVQTDPVKFAAREFVQMVPIFPASETLIKTTIRS